MPSYAPKSFTETEIENRLAIAREREAMNSVQNRVPSAADRVSSFDIWRHYYKRDRNLMGPILPSISRVTGKVVLIGFHSSDYGVISNDADRFKRFHSYCFGVHEHTLPHGARIAFQWLRCFTCATPTSSGRFRFIDSVLPTKHLFGHDRP